MNFFFRPNKNYLPKIDNKKYKIKAGIANIYIRIFDRHFVLENGLKFILSLEMRFTFWILMKLFFKFLTFIIHFVVIFTLKNFKDPIYKIRIRK